LGDTVSRDFSPTTTKERDENCSFVSSSFQRLKSLSLSVFNVLPPHTWTTKGRIVRVRRLGRPGGVVVVFGWWWFSRGEKSPRAREPENASVFRPIRPTHRTAMDVLVSARRDVLSAGVPRPRVLHRDVRTGDL